MSDGMDEHRWQGIIVIVVLLFCVLPLLCLETIASFYTAQSHLKGMEHNRSEFRNTANINQCTQFQKYWQLHCQNSTLGLIQDRLTSTLRVSVEDGQWHSLSEIRKLVSDPNLTDTFSYYAHSDSIQTFIEIDFRCSKPSFINAFKTAQRVWLPQSCQIPLSSYSESWDSTRTLPLLPQNYTIVMMGNSYIQQIKASLIARSHIRNELTEAYHLYFNALGPRLTKSSPFFNLSDLTKSNPRRIFGHASFYRFKNGARVLSVYNHGVLCFPEDQLLSIFIDFLNSDRNNSKIDMVLVDPGNPEIWGAECFRKRKSIQRGPINLTVLHQSLLRIQGHQSFTWLSGPRLHSRARDGLYDYTFNYPLFMKKHRQKCHSEKGTDKDCRWGSGHQCTPGNPDSMSEALSTNAYLHQCQAHRWLFHH